MSWSPQQDGALKRVQEWLRDPRGPQIFRLFGYAGTGKTTLAKEAARMVKGHVCFGAFTGKAALMLRNKGCGNASTIHSLIYKLEDNGKFEPTFVLNEESEVDGAALVIIDECSMVDEELAHDLLSFGARILVLGDPEQLPPVKGAGYFTENCTPDVMLTEVHRQAADNPIIAMSMRIRQGQRLDYGRYGESAVIRRAEVDQREVLNAAQILCGYNKTRVAFNRRIRQLLKRTSAFPVKGEKLVCLRNDRNKSLLNGGLWTVAKARTARNKNGREFVAMDVLSDDVPGLSSSVEVLPEFFVGGDDQLDWKAKRGFQEFTYGYCLTVHKSQGSQWPDVYFFDENMASLLGGEGYRRFVYTAITRAAERITMVR